MPFYVGGWASFIGAVLVWVFVPESKEARERCMTEQEKENVGRERTKSVIERMTVPRAVDVISFTGCLNSIAKSTVSSMFGIFAYTWFGLTAYDCGMILLTIAAMELIIIAVVVQPSVSWIKKMQ